MSTLTQRSAAGPSDSKATSPLDVLDETPGADGAPIDEAEQKHIISALKEQNDRNHKTARGGLLALIGGVAFLYITPLPAYLTNTHPDTHVHLLFVHHSQETAEHHELTRLPVAPIYILFLLSMGTLLYATGKEVADRMGILPRPPGVPFPAPQPHLFGTAPGWLVKSLTDLRWHPSNSGQPRSVRADLPANQGGETPPNFLTKMNPRNLYVFMIWLASWPLPLMTFGAGAFESSAWWALTPAVIGIVLAVEGIIYRAERDLKGLDGMRYGYKGA
ncbi:hypothetical protein CBOM_02598 [Ceraceosorus bombacis]|uniref:Uncharacterized protein n=1 Tax=Ceraceosorus bombacis TaxID=401625 RepID=A0A0P1BGV7_9BASI|nr:hypothetical protein CBOM_02598 [Ceraceosorus bombacis]